MCCNSFALSFFPRLHPLRGAPLFEQRSRYARYALPLYHAPFYQALFGGIRFHYSGSGLGVSRAENPYHLGWDYRA